MGFGQKAGDFLKLIFNTKPYLTARCSRNRRATECGNGSELTPPRSVLQEKESRRSATCCQVRRSVLQFGTPSGITG